MKNKVMAAGLAAAMATGGAAQAQEVFEMTSAFSRNLPILGTAGVDYVEKINSISRDVEFEHFDPGGVIDKKKLTTLSKR